MCTVSSTKYAPKEDFSYLDVSGLFSSRAVAFRIFQMLALALISSTCCAHTCVAQTLKYYLRRPGIVNMSMSVLPVSWTDALGCRRCSVKFSSRAEALTRPAVHVRLLFREVARHFLVKRTTHRFICQKDGTVIESKSDFRSLKFELILKSTNVYRIDRYIHACLLACIHPCIHIS